ncbi:dicarboxylate/amino acid:cation symporter [Methylobacterium brachythecii]|uniref:C4-dicarboxylate transport protein n=1 Tax=Methylobacterium brachythecii TaxID=1176177 RepID=A0A7W6F9C0_9HYPH|nr:dicarboxylate/amino acid:cation symporter [Methylobacterium brachythecii]MBB3905373.1 aerobic C4-dicarboxylate transport protein [Methylobacterium brachythecii]GLS45910.1 C4-dicarboxylate transport protein [Methylobacterium brachythecii]
MDAAVATQALDEIPLRREAWYRRLWLQVLIAIALGGLLGALFPQVGESLKPLGDALIKAIRMTIAPIVFCTVVHGIASMSDMRRAGRIGWKAIVYFEIGTTLALILGLVVINVVRPGAGMHVDVATLDAKAVQGFISRSQHETVTGFLLDIIPNTVVGAFANGEMLQVLFFAILFAIAAQRVGEPGRRMVQLVDDTAKIFFQLLGTIMRFAPLGAFGAMAFTIGKYGLGAVVSLSQFMLCFYATCLLFIFGVLGVVCRLMGFSVWKLIRYLKEELLLVFGFSASEPVLPRFMVKMQKAGCGEPIVGLVIPTGYSFNLDGTCIYLTMAALFLAQATDTDLSLAQQVGIVGILLLTSKGAAAVTGSGFIVLAATLGTVGHIPVASIALIFGIDRFMSEARALTNFIGTAVATVVVSKWEGELDERAFERALG